MESRMDDRMARLRKMWRMKAPLESALTVLGYAVYVLGALSLLAVLFLFTSLDEKDPGFPAGEGFLKAIKGYGIGLFAVGAVVCYYLGRWLLDSRVTGARENVAARYESSRISTLLAADPDFQTAGSWEWRERVAYQLVPELREYAESDDWADRRFAQRAIKDAWDLYLKSRDAD
jgi:hypothetical protein